MTMKKKLLKKRKDIYKNIAKHRITRLFQLACDTALAGDIKLANRYVMLARKISMRYLVKMPKEYKLLFCKYCYGYMLPGVNTRVRINKGRRTVTCLQCKGIMRMPLKSK
ncbi:MAG: ribonuclease P protein component 4 [Candidatus Thermoplasmatota archaeon]